MRVLIICSVLLVVSSVALAGYAHGGLDGGSSYAVVTKHDVPIHSFKYARGLHDGGYLHGGYQGLGLEHGYGYYDKYDYHHKYPKYQFDYGVKDLKTGDIKNQWEHRDGDHVKGGYSLKESDGTTRVVEYSADDHNGFNAIVKNIGHAHHPQIYTKGHLGAYGYGNSLEYGGHYGAGYGHDHGHGHGHASSYVNVKQL